MTGTATPSGGATDPAGPAQTLRRLEGLVLAVSVVVALFAARPSAEWSSHMAFDVSARMQAGPFARVHLPEGLDTETFRPLSIVLVRVMAALGTPLDAALGLGKGLLAVVFAVVGLRWARGRGLGAAGALAVLATLVSAPGLFNAWHLTEFDLLAATLFLAGDLALLRARAQPGLPSLLRAALPWLAVALLKDSAGVLAVTTLLAQVIDERRDGLGLRGPAPPILLLVGTMLGTFLLLGATPTGQGGSAAGPAAAVVLTQWTFLLGLPSLLALGLGRWSKLPSGLAAAAVALHLFVPDFAWHSLFLCMPTGRGFLATLSGALLPEFELGRHTKPVFRGPGTPRTSMPT